MSNSNMLSRLLQIHTNSFLPLESKRSFLFNNCVPYSSTFTCRSRTPKSKNPHSRLQFQFQFQTRTRSIHCRSLLGNSEPRSESEPELQEVRNAVSTFLQQFGVSEDQSLSIASNSPCYLRMLIDGVRDLDHLSMWDSDKQIAGFHDKVLHIATHRGDNGKVAYLESLGFSLPSAMNVARYLSAETLPALIHKVKSIKELFFSGSSDYDEFLVKNVRLMIMQLSIPIDEDLQRTLSFFEKVEARRGGLNTLASKDAAFHCLIESFPRLLLLSVNNHMTHLVEFLENIGIPRFGIQNIVVLFPPILLWNVEVLKTRVLALKEIGVVDKDYAKLLLKYPWVLSTSIRKNYKEVIAFFDCEKVPKAWFDHAIKSQPHLLGCSTSKLKLMVDQFAELGVPSKKLGQVIAKSPQLLLRKPEDFLQVVMFFENMGFGKESIGRILARCPEIFAASINKTLQRKIEFLSRVGVSKIYLPRVIKKYPDLLVSDTDRTLLPRMMYLMKLGLSEKDVAFMVRTFSPLLGYSIEEVLRPKIEFLVNSMERPVRDVVGYPRYFSYSLEKKIKPRFWVLKRRNIECSLKDMLGKNDEEFAAEFMGIGRVLLPPSRPHDKL